MTGSPWRRPRVLLRAVCVALATLALSGCIIVPDHHWRAWPGYSYYR
jgi:hypothetical protein